MRLKWIGKVAVVALVALTMWAGVTDAYTGACGIWAFKSGDYVGANFAGTQVGMDAAKTYVGNAGMIQAFTGCAGTVVPGALADSVIVYQHENGTWVIYGGAKVGGRPVFKVVGDVLVADGGLKLEDPGAGTNTIKLVAPSTPTTHTLTLPGANASGFLQNNGSGTLSWTSGSADTSGLIYQAGKLNGQTVIGSTAGSAATNTYLALRGYTNATTSGAAYLYLKQDAELHGANIILAERNNSIGWNLNTGSGFVNATLTGATILTGGAISGTPLTVKNGTATGSTVVTSIIQRKTGQNSNLTNWLDESGTVLAYVDKNGNFSGASSGSANSFRADTIQAYKRYLGGDSYNNGFGVFTDSLRTNGPLTVGGDCNFGFGKLLVRDSTRANAGIYVGGQLTKKILSATAALDFPSITGPNTSDLTITVTGAAVGDAVFVGAPNGSVTAATIYTGWVSASDTVTIRATVLTGTVNPSSGTFRVDVFQH